MRSHSLLVLVAALALASSAVVVACDAASDGPPSPKGPADPSGNADAGLPGPGALTLTLPDEVEIVAGGSATLDVAMTRSGVAEDIVLTVSDLPSGVTATPVTIAAGQAQATITLTAAASARQGASGKVSVTGSAAGTTGSAATAVFVRGAPGTIDTSLGDAGLSLLPASEDVIAGAVAVQADGKIVVGGYKGGAPSKAYLSRIDASGALDATFGAGGGVIVDFGLSSDEEFLRVAIDPSGAILATGFNFTGGDGERFLAARLRASGELDTTFNITGKYTGTYAAGSGARLASSILQKDGRLVVIGGVSGGGGSWAAARITPQGGTDATFGAGGAVLFEERKGYLRCGGQQSDGKLALGGVTYEEVNGKEVARWAFTRLSAADGSVDTSYGTNGLSMVALPVASVVEACTLDAGDRLIAVGRLTESGISEFALGRYDTSANPDPGLHSGALVRIPLGSGEALPTGVFVQGDGKIVVAGHSASGMLTVVRLGADGARDETFATGGIFAASGGLSARVAPTYSAIDVARRRVVLAGTAMAGTVRGIFAARVWL